MGEAESENPKQALCCQRWAWCGAWTHELWDHDLSWNQESDAQLTKPPRRPRLSLVLMTLTVLKTIRFFFFFNVCLFVRRDRVQAGEGQRERETQNLKQAPGSELSAQSPTRGLNSWDHDLSRSRMFNLLSYPGAPRSIRYFYITLQLGFGGCWIF